MSDYSEVSVRSCEWCDKAFQPSRKDAVYCSRQCKGNARRARKARLDRVNQAREGIPFTSLEEFDDAPGFDDGGYVDDDPETDGGYLTRPYSELTAGTSRTTAGTSRRDEMTLDELMAMPVDSFAGQEEYDRGSDDGGYLDDAEEDDEGIIDGGYLRNTTAGTSDAFTDARDLDAAIKAIRAEYDAALTPYRAQLRRNPGVKPPAMTELEHERDDRIDELERAAARAHDYAAAVARQPYAVADAADRQRSRTATDAFARDLPGRSRRAPTEPGWHGRESSDVWDWSKTVSR